MRHLRVRSPACRRKGFRIPPAGGTTNSTAALFEPLLRRRLPSLWVFAACALLANPALFAAAASSRSLLLDAALADSAVVAVGERGALLRSTDHGRTWRESNRPTGATLTGVTFAPDGHRGWAVGHDAVILFTNDAGRTWTRQFQGENLEDSFLDVLAIDDQQVIAVGAYGLYVATTNGGKSWARREIAKDDFHLNRISRGPTGTLYLAGEHGTLLRSTNGGRRWTAIPAPYEGSLYGILPLERGVLLAYGLRGHVYRSINDGAAWTRVATPQAVLLATAARLPNGAILLGGHPQSMLFSRDHGETFAPLTNAPASAIAELLVLPNGTVLACGEAGATLVEHDAR